MATEDFSNFERSGSLNGPDSELCSYRMRAENVPKVIRGYENSGALLG